MTYCFCYPAGQQPYPICLCLGLQLISHYFLLVLCTPATLTCLQAFQWAMVSLTSGLLYICSLPRILFLPHLPVLLSNLSSDSLFSGVGWPPICCSNWDTFGSEKKKKPSININTRTTGVNWNCPGLMNTWSPYLEWPSLTSQM